MLLLLLQAQGVFQSGLLIISASKSFFFLFVLHFLINCRSPFLYFFFLNETAPPEFSPLPLHTALPILFIELRMSLRRLRAMPPGVEDGEQSRRTRRPEPARRIQQSRGVRAVEACGSGEAEHGKVRGSRNSDLCIGGGDSSLWRRPLES